MDSDRVVVDISTHALTEGDYIDRIDKGHKENFNSRPHGGRQGRYKGNTDGFISTHALTEGDGAVADSAAVPNISTHALTEGDDCRCSGRSVC